MASRPDALVASRFTNAGNRSNRGANPSTNQHGRTPNQQAAMQARVDSAGRAAAQRGKIDVANNRAAQRQYGQGTTERILGAMGFSGADIRDRGTEAINTQMADRYRTGLPRNPNQDRYGNPIVAPVSQIINERAAGMPSNSPLAPTSQRNAFSSYLAQAVARSRQRAQAQDMGVKAGVDTSGQRGKIYRDPNEVGVMEDYYGF